jgi:hypothetical protein
VHVTILIFEFQETHFGATNCHLVVQDRDGIMDGMKFTVKEMVRATADLYMQFHAAEINIIASLYEC